MITISVLTRQQLPATDDLPSVFACWLELTNGQDTLYLPTTAPIDTHDLAAHFQAQAETLWPLAQQKGHTNPFASLPERVLLQAIAQHAGLPATDLTYILKSLASQ